MVVKATGKTGQRAVLSLRKLRGKVKITSLFDKITTLFVKITTLFDTFLHPTLHAALPAFIPAGSVASVLNGSNNCPTTAFFDIEQEKWQHVLVTSFFFSYFAHSKEKLYNY